MSIELQFTIALFGAAAFALLVLVTFAWHRPWLMFVVKVLLCVWLYQAQWYARAFMNVRWLDDDHTRFMHDAVLQAIADGKTTLPLAKATSFDWKGVCVIGPYTRYPEPEEPGWPSKDNATLRQVLGTDVVANDALNEEVKWLFGHGDGYVEMADQFGRFSRAWQNLPRGRYYKARLQGQGYWVMLQTHVSESSRWGHLCFKPEEAWLEIEPEPGWTDNIPVIMERMRKQKH